jgi:heavy metal sensor kinase
MSAPHPRATAAERGGWWRRRSLKLRLALWFALIACGLILALLPAVYLLVERRLLVELDRQIEIDWVLIEAHLEGDGGEGVRWRADSPSTLSEGGYAESWFDVWSGGVEVMSHWPSHGARLEEPPRIAEGEAELFHDLSFAGSGRARALERTARVGGRDFVLRVLRDKSAIQSGLGHLLLGLGLGAPVAVLLAATGGYFMAGRALRPIVEMTEQARRITSASLSRRLPNPNPHDELGRLATVFNETLERLEGSFEALRRFTADASHELRTPLTALRSVGEIALRETDEAEPLRDSVGSMLEEAQRLHDLVDALLMLARAESGQGPRNLGPVPLDALAAEVCERLEVLAAEKGQTVALSAEPELVAEADPLLLRQAATNLLHNAIRHSPPGTAVRVDCFAEGDDAVLEVADEGPGIAPEHRERVFERFYRIDKARSRADGGAGLGLALAKLFVEQCGGSIGLSDAPGGGSRFRIRLSRSGAGLAEESSAT